jgi:hypothetical protein
MSVSFGSHYRTLAGEVYLWPLTQPTAAKKETISTLAEEPNNRSDPRRVVGRKSKVLIVLKRGGAA